MLLQKVAGPFREFGPVAGLLYAIDRVLLSISPRLRLQVYEMMVQPIPDRPLLSEKMRAHVEIREIPRDAPEIALMPVRPDAMAARLRQKTVCLGAFRKGKFIGYMWFSHEKFEEDHARCTYLLTPPEHSVFDFDFYLFPEHRLGLGFVALWNGANEYLRARGIRQTYSRLDRFNLASRRAHDHLGWKRVGQVLILQLWTVELMLADMRPFVNLSLRTSSRARLTLRPNILLSASQASAV